MPENPCYITITATPSSSCVNLPVVLSAIFPTYASSSFSGSYVWSSASLSPTYTNSSTFTVTPSSSGIYTYNVTGSIYYPGGILACSASSSITFTVIALPTLTITPTSSYITLGQSCSLSASGASTYLWSGPGISGSISGSSIIAYPTTNAVYTVTGANINGCISTATAIVRVSRPIAVNNITGSIVINPTGSGGPYSFSF